MTHEEFTTLTKVETTMKYYTEEIEPLYVAQDADKTEFVAQWLKDNKANIVKAHAFDIDRVSRALALADMKAADNDRLKAENAQLQHDAEKWQTKYEAASANWKETAHMAEVYMGERNTIYNQLVESESSKERIGELEAEIIRLKARLFDMMESQSA